MTRKTKSAKNTRRGRGAKARAGLHSQGNSVARGRSRVAKRGGLAALLFVLIAAVHSNSLSGQFVFDDVYFIEQNPLIRSLANAPQILSSAFWEASSLPTPTYYRPMVVLSYALNFAFGGFDPFGYHVVNVLLHAANAVLLFGLVGLLTKRVAPALAVGLLFGLHPIQTESVAWISGRTGLLAAFFGLLSLLLYVWLDRSSDTRLAPPAEPAAASGRRSFALGAASALCLFLALLSKESALVLPGVFVLYDLTFHERFPGARRILPSLAVLALYLGARFLVLGGAQAGSIYFVANPLVAEATWPRLLTTPILVGKYLSLLLLPSNLSVDYSFDSLPTAIHVTDPRVFLSVLALLALAGLAIWAWRRERLLFFGLAFFFTTGGLVFSNALFPFAPILAERFMYLPTAGLALAATTLGHVGIDRLPPTMRRAATAIALISVLLVFGTLSRSRNLDWQNELRLFQSATETQPENAVAHFGLANQLYRQSDFEAAQQRYRRALEIYPKFAPAWIGLGNVAIAQGQLQRALDALDRARRLDPNDPELYTALSAAHGQAGQIDQALRAAEKALSLNPNSSQIHNNLANLRHLQGDRVRALAGWEKAVSIDPFNAEALYNLGYAYERAGDATRSRDCFERFIALAPEGMQDVIARLHTHLRSH